MTIPEALIEAAWRRGARHCFGVPGSGALMDLIDAGRRRGVEFVSTANEASAAIAAAYYGHLRGCAGLALAIKGPGSRQPGGRSGKRLLRTQAGSVHHRGAAGGVPAGGDGAADRPARSVPAGCEAGGATGAGGRRRRYRRRLRQRDGGAAGPGVAGPARRPWRRRGAGRGARRSGGRGRCTHGGGRAGRGRRGGRRRRDAAAGDHCRRRPAACRGAG